MEQAGGCRGREVKKECEEANRKVPKLERAARVFGLDGKVLSTFVAPAWEKSMEGSRLFVLYIDFGRTGALLPRW